LFFATDQCCHRGGSQYLGSNGHARAVVGQRRGARALALDECRRSTKTGIHDDRRKEEPAMTAARLHLVDEAKGDTAGKRRRDAAQGEAIVTTPNGKARAASADRERAETAEKTQPMPASRTRVRPRKRASCVGDVMRSPAVCCRMGDSLHRVAQLMWEHDVGALVVLDDAGRACHVITDRDVCMGAYTQGVALWASHVGSVKPGPLVSCSVDAGVVEVRNLMQEHGVRRIPVLDAAGSVVGVVGLGDLVREATINAPKARMRALTPPQLAQTLVAVYEDVPVPPDRVQR
jgi:CBS domain-containing protein